MLEQFITKQLLEACAREFKTKIEQALADVRFRATFPLQRAPFTDDYYDVESQTLETQQRILDALLAQVQFRWQAPTWAPELPLTLNDCMAMEKHPNPRVSLVGMFAYSLRYQDWDYQLHPSFERYAGGMMAYPDAPEEVRADARLLREYPPRPLAGLADECTHWRTPAQIATDRVMAAWGKEMNDRQQLGIVGQPIEEWTRTQLPMWCGGF